MAVNIRPAEEQVEQWIDQYIPEKDLFFVDEAMLENLDKHLDGVLIMPRKEFSGHSAYSQIQMNNSYMYWTLSKQATSVIVAPPDWLDQLPRQQRRTLLFNQCRMGRGMIFPMGLFPSAEEVLGDHVVEVEAGTFVVIRKGMWNRLPYPVKAHAIQAYARMWDTWEAAEVPEETPAHIRKYANRFTAIPGSNCFASALYAVTGQEWMVHEWIHPETLMNGLRRAGYSPDDGELMPGDVITYVNQSGEVRHAAYHIGQNLIFNKNGQTFFNPWKIVSLEELNGEWAQYEIRIHRRAERR
ncbi:hypothetical protein C772_00892 [Bhargavaea cecembensis DSE10]|uniref:Uncharacterized protein n=1 Tax=Bhargavaea cecembensis DSE10 TaxID=1235279 RepID=M7NJ42_9BACL|nr:hypothetical protein [Bhargavaea cecembensis]EMR07247.1 hypothetical protein C772_00892 [Bhargavaea cecembensis DSE10]